MTWHETIEYIQRTPSFAEIVENTYILPDLQANVERFRQSAEFQETLRLIKHHCSSPQPLLLDIGAGNGIATIAFALEGFKVVALEPDPSPVVGSGAILQLMHTYQLPTIELIEAFGEKLPFNENHFDIVYGRQVMHHAHNLSQFVSEAARVLKKGGVFFTTRDHVIKNEKDKRKFLKRHSLHKFYGGENAFQLTEYRLALQNAPLKIVEELSPSASVINYDPWTKKRLSQVLSHKFGAALGNQIWFIDLAWQLLMVRQERLPGKLYSFIARKISVKEKG